MKRLLLLTLMIVFISGDALAWGVRYPCARWITDDDRRPIERPSSEEAFSAPRAIPLESARSVQMLFELSARMTEIPSSFMPGNIIDAQNVNDFDEAPDSTWFTNRIGRREMTDRELKAGPGKPSLECGEKLEVLALGRTLSFAWLTAEDRRGKTFLMTFDSPKFRERSTGAGMIASRVLHAVGYNVAPTGLFRVNPRRFSLSDGALFRDKDGNTRPAVAGDLSAIFPHHRGGAGRNVGVRALVTEKPEGTFIGPFSYSGRHKKDPNDRIPHQHRRELRGLSVFSAWLDNRLAVESRTADVFVGTENDGAGHVVHYLFGFESSLGNHERALEGFEGYVHPSAQLSPIVMGLPNITLYSQREKPETRISHEAFEVESFEPLLWMPAVPNAAFSNSVTRDSLWASFILSRFTDDRISAIVSTAEFSDRRISDETARILAGRRDKLLKTWFSTQSPLGDFEVKRAGSGFEVTGRDVAVDSNLPGTEGSVYMWRLRTINRKANLTEWAEAQRPSAFVDGKALNLMRQGRLHDLEIAAKRAGEDWPMHSVHVLVRKTGGGELEIAGITRRSAR